MVDRFSKLVRTFLPIHCPFLEEATATPLLRDLHVGCLRPFSLSVLGSAHATTVEFNTAFFHFCRAPNTCPCQGQQEVCAEKGESARGLGVTRQSLLSGDKH